MKLKDTDVGFIEKVIKAANIVGIDNIILEADCVRAMDSDQTVVILETENIPEFDFNSIGLNRVNILASRLDIAKTQEKFHIDALMDDNNEFVRSLTMKGTGSKIEYRCANPIHMRAPKQIKDEPVARIPLNGEIIFLMQKGMAAMGADSITLISNDEVTFEFVDVNNDVFSHVIADEAEPVNPGDSTKFAHKYPVSTLLSLFKNNPDGYFEVGGSKGMLSIKVNGLTFYVLPQV